MFDDATAARMQRSHGRAAVTLARGGRLRRLEQQGSAKAFLPRVHGTPPEVVFLNTSGGLTGGDRLALTLELEAGAAATATTQTAERAYASAGGAPAEVAISLTAGAGAALDWLPQETILYDRSALTRRTRIALAGDARLVWAEMLVLGRTAMGERVTALHLHDRREITRAGALALLEPVRLEGAALGSRPGLTGAARAFASVVLMAPGAEAALGAVRAALAAALPPAGAEAAASAWDGRCVVRVAAPDGLPMRRVVAAVLGAMRPGVPLPRVWPA